jgi:predicted nucleic acid-binding protein
MVVDASVWVSALVVHDTHHTASRRWLRRHSSRTTLLVVPTLALAEVASAISRRTGDPVLGLRSMEAVLSLPRLRLVPLDPALGSEAGRIAADHGLRGADAVYVATAARHKLPLVTLDAELRARIGRLVRILRPA